MDKIKFLMLTIILCVCPLAVFISPIRELLYPNYQDILGISQEYLIPSSMAEAFNICNIINKNIISTQYDDDLYEGSVIFDDDIKFTYKDSYEMNEVNLSYILEFDEGILSNETIKTYFNNSLPLYADKIYEDYMQNNNFEKKYEDVKDNEYLNMSVSTLENGRKEIKLKYFMNIK